MCIRDRGVVASAETGSTAAVSDIKRDGPDETPWEAQWIGAVSYTHLEVYKRQQQMLYQTLLFEQE